MPAMQVCLIWAQDLNGAIGKSNQLPWHLPEDLKHFKEVTLKHPVIMGRKTWESLPRRPLPGRMNIVVSENALAESAPGALVVRSVIEAVNQARKSGAEKCFVIGGARMYQEALETADVVCRTLVDARVADADTFAPPFSSEWTPLHRGTWQQSSTQLSYRIETWVRSR